MTESTDTQSVEQLLRAARLLLRQCAELDAVHVLHTQAARAMGHRAPPPYTRRSEARAQQQRLQQLLEVRTMPAVRSPVQRWARSLPWWTPRAALAGLIVLLTLRYAWAVTFNKDWARQNPEGNWISRYYRGDKFEGHPMLRYDVGVNADFAAGGPVNDVSKDFFSIRWDVCVEVTREVAVPLTLTADDAGRVLLDGELQLQVEPGPGVATADMVLKPGVRQLRVEFVEGGGMAMVRLEGLELLGTEAYRFVRPRVEGMELRCGGR